MRRRRPFQEDDPFDRRRERERRERLARDADRGETPPHPIGFDAPSASPPSRTTRPTRRSAPAGGRNAGTRRIASQPTDSELAIQGLLKHVATCLDKWNRFGGKPWQQDGTLIRALDCYSKHVGGLKALADLTPRPRTAVQAVEELLFDRVLPDVRRRYLHGLGDMRPVPPLPSEVAALNVALRHLVITGYAGAGHTPLLAGWKMVFDLLPRITWPAGPAAAQVDQAVALLDEVDDLLAGVFQDVVQSDTRPSVQERDAVDSTTLPEPWQRVKRWLGASTPPQAMPADVQAAIRDLALAPPPVGPASARRFAALEILRHELERHRSACERRYGVLGDTAWALAVLFNGLKRDNPKMPKAFTARTRIGNGQKMMELRLELLQDWVTIGALYNAVSPAVRAQIDEALAPDHVLDEVLGEDGWWQGLGLPDPAPVLSAAQGTTDEDQPMAAYVLSLPPGQREAIMRLEIAIGIKAGTDAEKTTVPVSALKQRALQVKQALRHLFGLTSVPYGKGLRRKLEQVYAGDAPLAALVRLVEQRLGLRATGQAQDARVPMEGLPMALMRQVGSDLLDRARAHLGQATLPDLCRVLADMPGITEPAYAEQRLQAALQRLQAPALPADAALRWPDLVPVLGWMQSPAAQAPLAAAVQMALLARLKGIPLFKDLDGTVLHRTVAEMVALAFDALATPGTLSPALSGWFQRMGADPACLAVCPELRDLGHGDARRWAGVLLRLLALEGIAPQPLPAPAMAGWLALDLSSCSADLARRALQALALSGAGGHYRAKPAPGTRRAMREFIAQHAAAWEQQKVTITLA